LAAAAEALLEARAAGNPVLVLAGDLRKDGALPALVTRHRLARGVIAYGLEPGQVKAAVAAAARAAGLRLDGEGAARLWAAAQGSLGVLAREAEKIALYLGATPAAPVRVEPDVLDRLLPGDETEDFGRLVMAVLTGDVAALDRELRAEPSPIPLFRGLMPRLLQLGELADVVATGRSPAEAVAGARPPVFWKDRDLMTRALGAWPPERVRAAMALLLEAERAIKTAGSAGDRLGRHAILSAALPPRRRGALGRAPLNS
jgi:DNA polymerase-3 subunit delta